MSNTETQPKSGWLNVAVDYGPLLVFLASYYLFSPEEDESLSAVFAVVASTAAFIVAAIIALCVSKILLGKVSRMLWLSTLLIVGFGSLTILLRDPFYIQFKPTALYAFFSAVLLIGWLRGKALLKWALEAAFEGLDDEGWLKLSRNWGFFFIVLASVNEALRHFYNEANGNFDIWLWAKFWIFFPATFLFTFTQVPMLMRHGLALEENDPSDDTPPPG